MSEICICTIPVSRDFGNSWALRDGSLWCNRCGGEMKPDERAEQDREWAKRGLVTPTQIAMGEAAKNLKVTLE